ncbi:MAG: hypothetical protein U5J83_16125 [Bryobacterales bacterium]|nr:hypothetical protein [Bryobacterales bacterium]
MRRTFHALLLFCLAAALALPALADDPDMTNITVEVMTQKEKPVPRASVVVRFVEGRSIVKLGKKIMTSYQLRTSNEGKVVVPPIPQGKILIQVIAKGFQTYGEYHEIYEETRTVPIKLKPPQSQYSAHDDEEEAPKKTP